MHIGYQLELRIYLVGVLVEGPLEVVGTHYTRLELGTVLYEAVCLLGTDGLHAMRCKEGIRYIFYTTNLGRKSLHI